MIRVKQRFSKFLFPLIRMLALVLPLILFGTSLLLKWPDELLQGRGIAIGTIQLATGSMLAWVLADSYIRMAQKRRLFRLFWESTSEDLPHVAFTVGHVLSHVDSKRPVVVVASDDCILDARQPICRAVANEDLAAVFLSKASSHALFSSTSVAEAIRVIREEFIRTAESSSFRESEALEIFRVASGRKEIVVVIPVFTSEEFLVSFEKREEFHQVIALLAERYRIVFVGSNRMVDSVHDLQPVVLDLAASFRANGHIQKRIALATPQSGAGARHLLSVIGREEFVQLSIVKKLRAASHMHPHETSFDSAAAAASLISSEGFFSNEEKTELINFLQYTSQGLEILAVISLDVDKLWSPNELSASSVSHLAVKRLFSLEPNRAVAHAAQYCAELSDSQVMDVIHGLRAHSPQGCELLFALSTDGRISIRFAAATRLIKTLKPSVFPGLVIPSSLHDQFPQNAIDTDSSIGAWGWIIPSLVLTWPSEYGSAWEETLHVSKTRDSSHLGLSIARGILLSATDFPMRVGGLISQVIENGPRFWLSDIKLVHAAGISIQAGDESSYELIDYFKHSHHPLVQATAQLVSNGLHNKMESECWSWGLESQEALALTWAQSDEVFRMLGKVAIEYGKFLRDLSPLNFSTVMAATEYVGDVDWNEDSFGLSPEIHRFHNATKKAQIEFGPAFSLRQSLLARTKQEKDFWELFLESSLQPRQEHSSQVSNTR